jgi:hypothetical protein
MQDVTYEEPDDRLGMNEEDWERFKRLTRGYGEQDENGVDLSLLASNLRLTPTQRLQKHQQALKLVLEMDRAGRLARLSAGARKPE